jgi:hypothetical protein
MNFADGMTKFFYRMKINIQKTSLVCFLIPVIFTGCLNNKPEISRLWFYTYSSDTAIDKNNLTPANFLELRPEGLFTSDLGQFKSGRWSLKDQRLFLSADDGSEIIVFIEQLKKGEMQVQTIQSKEAHFDASPIPKIDEDPFSKTNNLWRIPAKSKESDDQLRLRLRIHCRFWVNYFTWALNNELPTVDVRSTPTPIKIYGNGFTIKNFNDLPQSWKGYFYDSSDCARSNAILEELVRTHTIAWAHTDNKYKMFISAFQQMEQFLR